MLPTDVLLLVSDALAEETIPYCVGGSFASSTYGEPRATRDVDILVVLPRVTAPMFAHRLEPQFFLDLNELYQAIDIAPSLQEDPLHRATCNLVHRTSFFRVDLFVSSGRPFEVSQLARRIRQTVAIEPERYAYFASPEDTILNKLEWFNMAQGVLDRQWNDVRSVIATQKDILDIPYLRSWAAQLNISNLLEAALNGAPPPQPSRQDDSEQMRFDI